MSMKVATAIPKQLHCPHHNTTMEFGKGTKTSRPSWYCNRCEIDYTLVDLIKEGDMNPDFIVIKDE